ncbi:MAG: translocation/assembly module TamB domain-containing protein [Pseudomonadota bacterium]
MTLKGLGAGLPGRLRLAYFSLADNKGVWLKGEDLAVDWSLRDLFEGRLRLPRARLGKVVLVRRPEPPESPSASAAAPFELPPSIHFPSISLGKLEISRIILEQPLVSDTAEFTLKGFFVSAGPAASSRIDLHRVDGPSDGLSLGLDLTGSPPELTVKVEMNEAAGGTLGELMGMSPPGVVSASFTGSGPLAAWSGKLETHLENVLDLQVKIDLAVGEPAGLNLVGGLSIAPGWAPGEVEGFLGRRLDFDLKTSLEGRRKLLLRSLNARTATADVSLTADLDLETLGVEGSYVVTPLDLNYLFELAGVAVETGRPITGTVTGVVGRPTFAVSGDLGPVTFAGMRAELVARKLDFCPTISFFEGWDGFTSHGRVGLKGFKSFLDGLVPEDLEVEFVTGMDGVERYHITKFTADGGWEKVDFSGELDIDTLDYNTTTKVEIAELKRLAPFGRLGLSGEAAVETSLRGGFESGLIQADIRGQWKNIKGLPRETRSLSGKDLNFLVKGDYHDGAARLDLSAEGGKSRFSGQGKVDLEKKGLALDYKLDLGGVGEFLAQYGLEVSERGTIAGRLSGPWADPVLTAEAGLDRLAVGNLLFVDPRVETNWSGLAGDLHLGVKASAQAGKLGVSLGAEVEPRKDRTAIKGFELAASGVKVEGNLAVEHETGRLDGLVGVKAKDISPLAGFLGLGLGGSLDGAIGLSSRKQGQEATIKARGRNISRGDWRVGALSLDGRAGDLFGGRKLEASLNVENAGDSKVKFKKLFFSVAGDLDGMKIKVAANGAAFRPFSMKAEAELSRQGMPLDRTSLKINTFSGKFDNYPFRLAVPASVEKRGAYLSLDGLDLRLSSGSIKGSGLLTPERASIEVKAENMSLAPVNMFISTPVEGLVSGGISISGAPARPRLDSYWRVRGLRLVGPDPKDAPPVDFDLKIVVEDGLLSTRADLRGLGKDPGVLEASLPVRFSLGPFLLETVPDGDLSGRMNADLDLRLIPLLLSLDDQVVSGTARIHLTAVGSPGHPLASGSVQVIDGRYENLRTGTILKNIKVRMEAQGSKLTISEASAGDGEGGTVSAVGSILLSGEKNFPYDAILKIKNLRLIRLDLLRAVGSGALGINGDLAVAGLSGRIQIDPAELSIPKKMPVSMAAVEVEEINRPPEDAPAPPPASPMKVMLNVELIMPGRFFVRGNDLESEWKGRLSLTGLTTAPVIHGDLEVLRGKYSFLGKRFAFTSGLLSFSGADPPDPIISLTGEAETQDLTAVVKITGPIMNPRISLTSDPVYPQDEILARLLFGRTMNEITPLQALSLAYAASGLTGGSGWSLDPIGRARKLLGVDQIEVKENKQGQTQVGAGKYLGDRVYLQAESGFSSGDQKLTVEVEITPRLSLETDVGADAQGGLGINWKFDY